jgi:hypothetical protein
LRSETRPQPEPVALSWRVKERPGLTVVEFFGEIDENADFADLRRRLKGPVVFHLAEVRRINSCGVREWVDFVRQVPAVSELAFSHCSPAIVIQLNMIYNFRGQARVRSFLAPYLCQVCGHEEDKLLDVEQHFPPPPRRAFTPPEFKCEKCSGPMQFDELPERYLCFLHDA